MDYFIDTNIIIDFFNKKPDSIEKLRQLIEQEHNLHINELVYLEALRTINIEHTKIFQESKDFLLNYFTFVEINRVIYDNTISFSRFCRTEKHIYLKKCEAIDFLHFMTAKYYQLEILSNDKDMPKLEANYPEWMNSNKIQK